MSLYTMTLREVETIRDFNLFEPQDYVDYDHVKDMIRAEYGEQEIAYPAPDLFKRKLNNTLRLLCPNYNKMLQSQLIKIDPFVTEYIMSEGRDSTRTKEGQRTSTENTLNRGVDVSEAVTGKTNEVYTGKTTGDHSKQNAGVEVKGTLRSEAENIDREQIRDLKGTHSEDTEYSENTHETGTKDVTGSADTQKTDNQTGRQWTENGNSEGHNLDVHSDMPQSMLFNVPNNGANYFGTGREHMEGSVVGDKVEDYPETNPNAFDSADLSPQSASADSPWYNYATTADNKTGHDNYHKEGTETYQKSGTEQTDTTENEETVGEKDTTGSKGVDGTNTENETIHEGSGRALNINEHGKSDTFADEAYREQGTDDRNTDFTGESTSFKNTAEKEDAFGKEHRDLSRDTDTYNTTTFKGRRMMSPSKLLEQYRSTLTFNCDQWLLGELEPLFMQIF